MNPMTSATGNHSSIKKVRKKVLPAAGLGAIFAGNQSSAKEMLNVVDKPNSVRRGRCIASGIEHIIIVTGKGKNSIEDR